MSKKFVRFCVPTLFERRELNLRSFANLIRQAEEADIDYEIDIIANQNFEYFRAIDFEEYESAHKPDEQGTSNYCTQCCAAKTRYSLR